MGSLIAVTYTCDWINEFGHDCPATAVFEGRYHEGKARDTGWGWRHSSYRDTKRPMWHTFYTWFCPLHSKVFGANRGWIDGAKLLPPKNWENGQTRSKP